MRWGDCEIVYNKEDKKLDRNHYKEIIKFISMIPDAVDENIWFDKENESYFSNSMSLSEPICGQHHSFIANRSDFLLGKYPKNSSWMRSKYLLLREGFRELPEITSTELRLGFTEQVSQLRNQDSVLIVGGGPSTNEIDFSELRDIPKWSMNSYYQNKKINSMKNIQLVSFLDDVNLNDKALWDSVKRNSAFIIQEITEKGMERINKIKENHDKCSYFHTRYRSRLGVGARLVILAILLGTKNIYISGLDGYDINNSKTHSFETGKDYPGWLMSMGPVAQKQQFVMFWDYILNTLAKSYNFKIHDLAINCETSQYSFITKVAL